MKILVVNGPNINMLGSRERSHYGELTYEALVAKITAHAEQLGVHICFYQSNHEGELVGRIQEAADMDGIIINAAAYTHTSVAIRDALLSIRVPFIEVHLSNVFARESFRHVSYLSDVAVGVVSGFKEQSYLMALDYFARGVKG